MSGADPQAWALLNASPDVLKQLVANPDLQPARAPRDTALSAVLLSDGQVDHVTGLLLLRESPRPWPLYCTSNVMEELTQGNPIVEVLRHFCGTVHHPIEPELPFAVEGLATVSFRAIAVDGKPAPYSPHRQSPRAGDNVAFVIREQQGASAFYAPGLATIDATVWEHMQAAAVVLVDGTFWSDDEMIALGVSRKRARDLGHLPQSGPGGMLSWLDRLPAGTRKVLIHINNTNPILDEESAPAAQLRDHGVEVAYDGWEVSL